MTIDQPIAYDSPEHHAFLAQIGDDLNEQDRFLVQTLYGSILVASVFLAAGIGPVQPDPVRREGESADDHANRLVTEWHLYAHWYDERTTLEYVIAQQINAYPVTERHSRALSWATALIASGIGTAEEFYRSLAYLDY